MLFRSNTPKNATVKLPVLDESAAQRVQVQERAQQAQALAAERAQQAQERLRSQVSELESANQRLAAGEARFRRIFEANPLPMWIADRATGGFIAVNEAALALYGYRRAEFLALKSAALAATDGEPVDDATIVAHRRKDGARIAVSLASHEIEFDGREADLVSVYDLTERIAAQRALQQETAAGRTVLDASRRELDTSRAAADAANRELEASRATADAANRELEASRAAADAAHRELELQRGEQRQLEFLRF